MRYVLISLLLILGACANPVKVAAPEAEPEKIDWAFIKWVGDFKKDALAQGISKGTVDSAFVVVDKPDRVVLKLDRKQPEGTMTLEQYVAKTVSDSRIARGRELMEENKELLSAISAKYNVPPQYIVALWGIETSYGENTGGFSVISSLTTLAYDGRRSEYFRGELLNALRIIDADHIKAYDMDGSWAGAMGQCQFMPTSFLKYAVDYDGDGKRDIWNTNADVFASIANYLSNEGWGGNYENNFNVLLKWNRSRYFATAVMKIADAIKGENT